MLWAVSRWFLCLNNTDIVKRRKNRAHFEEVEADTRRNSGEKTEKESFKMGNGGRGSDIQWDLVEAVGWRVG